MTIAEAVLWVLGMPLLGASAYLALLALLSRRAPATVLAAAPHRRFDIVVPAHDEAAGISATVASLLALDYPPDLMRVVVVADNCSDDTAARARAAGASVIVRSDATRRGKGYALAHAFQKLLADGRAGAVAIVDADTVVSSNLLRVFDSHLEAGANAVQADYGVRNPDDSWRTRLMTIALATTHTLRSLARARLGVSCGLHGNGMCFTSALLRSVPYQAFSIVEDLEFGLQLGEAGYTVAYGADARVWGDIPASEAASRTQRTRWEGGRWRLVRIHALRLLWRGIRGRDRVKLDLAFGLLLPPLTTLAALIGVGLALAVLLSWFAGSTLGVLWLFAACAAGVLVYAARGWWLSGTGARGLWALWTIPRYAAWKLTLPLRRATHPRGEWVRTARREEQR
jgi:cellulose synthase/poly-beta-1,6-N-acetylglucosamine synthase-like glycosyltransferase